jgi:hypothetical protein
VNVPPRHFVNHKCHITSPGFEQGRPGGKPATNRLCYGTVLTYIIQSSLFGNGNGNQFSCKSITHISFPRTDSRCAIYSGITLTAIYFHAEAHYFRSDFLGSERCLYAQNVSCEITLCAAEDLCQFGSRINTSIFETFRSSTRFIAYLVKMSSLCTVGGLTVSRPHISLRI